MFCSNCGNELTGTENVCPACGTPVAKGAVTATKIAPAPAVEGAHASYEYARTSVANDLVTVTSDCYENLGYELTGSKDGGAGLTTLSFRRSRKVRSKAQLVKIQHTMDDLIASLARLEGEKTRKARLVSITVGTLCALVLGIGMCCTMVWGGGLMIVGVVVGVIGIAAGVAVWPLYRSIVAKETARVSPSIEAAYDSLATACEQAQTVLAA